MLALLEILLLIYLLGVVFVLLVSKNKSNMKEWVYGAFTWPMILVALLQLMYTGFSD